MKVQTSVHEEVSAMFGKALSSTEDKSTKQILVDVIRLCKDLNPRW
jgi:hypothetical protein